MDDESPRDDHGGVEPTRASRRSFLRTSGIAAAGIAGLTGGAAIQHIAAGEDAPAQPVDVAPSPIELSELFAPKLVHDVNLRALGALGDNQVNNEPFYKAARLAQAGRRAAPEGTSTDPLGTVSIEIPAGDYRITELMGLLGREPQIGKTKGLRFRGAGMNLTQIIFDPATDGPLLFNDYWLNIKFEGMSFTTLRAGATFLQSYTSNNAQYYTFVDVEWSGPWKYVLDLQGNNNNSEFSFYQCATQGMQRGGAFLYIGDKNTSDQLLNYWFFGFKHWSTSAAIVDAAKGGHFHFYGLDVSAYGSGLDTDSAFVFYLRGAAHAHGVQSLTVNGMRVEAKHSRAGLLYSEWAGGNVTIECDWSSQIFRSTYEDIIRLKMMDVGGPVYNFHDSVLAGGIQISYGPDTFKHSPHIVVENTTWKQRLTPSEVVSYIRPASNKADPSVQFIHCRGDNANPFGAEGASVWDATVGYRGAPLVKPLVKRTLHLTGAGGNLKTGDSSYTVNLPIGAIITGLRVLCPENVATEGNGATWAAFTTDSSPLEIVRVTVTAALSAGYSAATELARPFRCHTRPRATISVKAGNASQSVSDSMLILEGYW